VPHAFKPAYLIAGVDHGRIAERRARLRALGEEQSGAHGVELFEGESATPGAVAAALAAMTFALGRRFIIVDGVERWREKDLDGVEAALHGLPSDTTIAFFAREDSRAKAPARLADAVRAAGGDVSTESGVKPWELPKWVVAQAHALGLKMTSEAARALVAHVGERQQRLQRELEKLVLDLGAGAEVDLEEVEELTARSAERKAWSLADTLLGGDRAAAARAYLELRAQGERLPGLLYWVSSRVRQALRVAIALEAGRPVAEIRSTLRMPTRAADAMIDDAGRAGVQRLRSLVEQVADLELATRGGAAGGVGEDTAALVTIAGLT
jgi:DNA polymerase-3 subunit delta